MLRRTLPPRTLPGTLPGVLRRLAPTAAAIAVTGASFLPGDVKQIIHSRGSLHDVYHIAAFAVLTLLLCDRSPSRARHLLFAGWVILLGCTVEIAEAARNYAALEQMDMLCDGVGAALGLVLRWGFEIWRRHTMRATGTHPLRAPEPA